MSLITSATRRPGPIDHVLTPGAYPEMHSEAARLLTGRVTGSRYKHYIQFSIPIFV